MNNYNGAPGYGGYGTGGMLNGGLGSSMYGAGAGYGGSMYGGMGMNPMMSGGGGSGYGYGGLGGFGAGGFMGGPIGMMGGMMHGVMGAAESSLMGLSRLSGLLQMSVQAIQMCVQSVFHLYANSTMLRDECRGGSGGGDNGSNNNNNNASRVSSFRMIRLLNLVYIKLARAACHVRGIPFVRTPVSEKERVFKDMLRKVRRKERLARVAAAVAANAPPVAADAVPGPEECDTSNDDERESLFVGELAWLAAWGGTATLLLLARYAVFVGVPRVASLLARVLFASSRSRLRHDAQHTLTHAWKQSARRHGTSWLTWFLAYNLGLWATSYIVLDATPPTLPFTEQEYQMQQQLKQQQQQMQQQQQQMQQQQIQLQPLQQQQQMLQHNHVNNAYQQQFRQQQQFGLPPGGGMGGGGGYY